MNGVIYTEGFEPDEQAVAAMKAYVVKDAVRAVTCEESRTYPAGRVSRSTASRCTTTA